MGSDRSYELAAKLEICGAIFVCITGPILHFAFEWTNAWRPVALIAAVNESIWEHLKLCVWPFAIYSLFEYPFLRSRVHNFLVGKTVALYVMPLFIIIAFYGYTAAFGRNYLPVDIGLFFASVFLGFGVSWWIANFRDLPRVIHRIAAGALIIELLAFSLATFFPLEHPLFRDANEGHYGILELAPIQGSSLILATP